MLQGARFCVVLALALAGCHSAEHATMCSPGGAPCTYSGPCCGMFTCSDGLCVDPNAGAGGPGASSSCTGIECNENIPCCAGAICLIDQDDNGRCVQAFGGGGGSDVCGPAGATCTQPSDCCSGFTCPRLAAYSDNRCKLGDVGDHCTKSAGCLPNLTCNGSWCTKSCSSDVDCDANNRCIHIGGESSCFPACDYFQCAYPGTTCTMVVDVSSAIVKVCASACASGPPCGGLPDMAIPSNACCVPGRTSNDAGVGASCTSSDECASKFCSSLGKGMGYCSQWCSQNAQCGSGASCVVKVLGSSDDACAPDDCTTLGCPN